jgi:hypothetical protein
MSRSCERDIVRRSLTRARIRRPCHVPDRRPPKHSLRPMFGARHVRGQLDWSAFCGATTAAQPARPVGSPAGPWPRRPVPARGPVGPCPPVAPVSPSGPPPYCPGRACPCAGAWVRSLSPAASAPALPAAPDRAALCWAWARPPVLPPCRPPRTRPRWAWPRPPLLPAEAVHGPTRPDHSFRSARRLVPEPSIARCWAWPRPPCSHLDRRPGL